MKVNLLLQAAGRATRIQIAGQALKDDKAAGGTETGIERTAVGYLAIRPATDDNSLLGVPVEDVNHRASACIVRRQIVGRRVIGHVVAVRADRRVEAILVCLEACFGAADVLSLPALAIPEENLLVSSQQAFDFGENRS